MLERKRLLLTVALLTDLYVANIGADQHTVLLVLRSLVMVIAQGPIQPQGKPVPLPATEDRACGYSRPPRKADHRAC